MNQMIMQQTKALQESKAQLLLAIAELQQAIAKEEQEVQELQALWEQLCADEAAAEEAADAARDAA